MVTIRISDRQRLIQPYIHNYSWLLFAALALYSAHLASVEDMDGEKLDPQARSNATILRSQCMKLVGDCLMKAHQGKGDCSSGTETKAKAQLLVQATPQQKYMPQLVLRQKKKNPVCHRGLRLVWNVFSVLGFI